MSEVVPAEELDPILLDARLRQLRSDYNAFKSSFVPPTNATEQELAELKAAYDAKSADMIEEQISLIARLRRTSTTGPAKKGGKRAKAAPIDLSNLMSE